MRIKYKQVEQYYLGVAEWTSCLDITVLVFSIIDSNKLNLLVSYKTHGTPKPSYSSWIINCFCWPVMMLVTVLAFVHNNIVIILIIQTCS